MGDEWLTLQEAVARLKLHPDTLRRWLKSGKIRGTLLSRKAGWRIPASEVARVLDGGDAMAVELEQEQDHMEELDQLDEEEARMRFKFEAQDIARDAEQEARREAEREARARRLSGAAWESFVDRAMRDAYAEGYRAAWEDDFPVYLDRFRADELERISQS